MTRPSPKPDLQFSDRIWLEVFEGAFLNDAELAGEAARLWRYLLDQIEAGPEGITRARQALEIGIRVAFPFTPEYQQARERFESSLESPQPD